MPCIYLTINKFNRDNGILPWRYIGSDQFDRNEYLGSSFPLLDDIDQIGSSNFEKIILDHYEHLNNKELRFIESKFLSENNVKEDPTYYNLTDKYAPASGKKGMKRSKKFSRSDAWKNSRKGWIPGEETRLIWIKQRTGKKASAKTKEKMSKINSGSGNPNSLEWRILLPNGNLITIKGLRKYAKDNNLSFHKLYSNNLEGYSVSKIGIGKGGGRRSKNEK